MPDPVPLKPDDIWPPQVPLKFMLVLKGFMAERKTGNITLQIREGRILGWRAEELHSN